MMIWVQDVIFSFVYLLGFICSLERYTFEKNADGFKPHIERDHELWNYLYYIHYIESKDQTELNGIESYVVDNIQRYSIDWYLLYVCMNKVPCYEVYESIGGWLRGGRSLW